MLDTEDDINADILAAIEAHESPAPVDDAPAPVEAEVSPEEAEKTTGERERGPDGKFVAKSGEPEQDTADQPLEAEVDKPFNKAYRPPSSWSPEAKSAFASLPEPVKQAIGRREQEVDLGFQKKGDEIKRYQPLEEMIAPRRDKWALAGMDDVSALRTLFAAQDVLDTNPVQGLQHLMRAYNVTAAQLAGQPEGQAQPTGQPPQDNALLQRIAHLEHALQSGQQASFQSQIEAFQSDPANLYFENVRGDMAKLLDSGQAGTLKEAYEMACWMRPDIRALLQVPQVASPNPEKVQRAKIAGASVTGSPAEPVKPASNPNASVEDDIKAAILELNGR